MKFCVLRKGPNDSILVSLTSGHLKAKSWEQNS